MAKKKALKNKKSSFLYFKEIPFNVLVALVLALSAIILLKKESIKVLGLKTTTTVTENSKEWEKIVSENPDYRDGWLQLCAAYFEEGEKQKAKEALQMAKTLDPNNEKILLLEKLIEE
ncbi:tetratricopeptide repeat protein [Patescibacteria group bacterium]|nr:tetratricopeptide repeat protein [Patescibacteria group bacterium]